MPGQDTVLAREKQYQKTEASVEGEKRRKTELVVLNESLFKARNEENGAVRGVLKGVFVG